MQYSGTAEIRRFPGDRLPVIFIIDWDGTIAGRVEYQSHVYALLKSLRKYKAVKGYDPTWAFSPATKLIRPGLKDWMTTMRQFYGDGNVFFFIYTASETAWAEYEIKIVEKSHGIQFHRPLFTRKQCKMDATGGYVKSIDAIFPTVARAVGAAQKRAFTKPEREFILANKLMVIDNNAVYTDRTDRLLLCPDYRYAVFENLQSIIPRELYKTPEIAQFVRGLSEIGAICPYKPELRLNDEMRELTKSYEWLAKKCRAMTEENEVYGRDRFWRFLQAVIVENGIRNYTKSIIKQLQEAVWKATKSAAAAAAATAPPKTASRVGTPPSMPTPTRAW